MINYTEQEAKGESDCLTEEQLEGIVNKKELLIITQKHCPNQAFAFWILEAELEKTELEIGQDIRLKTKGDGPFICECYFSFSVAMLLKLTGYCTLNALFLFLCFKSPLPNWMLAQ